MTALFGGGVDNKFVPWGGRAGDETFAELETLRFDEIDDCNTRNEGVDA